MAETLWLKDANEVLWNGTSVRYAETCCLPCQKFLYLYDLAVDPDLEVEITGVDGGTATAIVCGCFNQAFVLDSSVNLAACTGSDISHEFVKDYTCFLNAGSITLTIGNIPEIRIDGIQETGFGAPGIVAYLLSDCQDILDAIDDLFDGLDVEVPALATGNCTYSDPAILRLA